MRKPPFHPPVVAMSLPFHALFHGSVAVFVPGSFFAQM